MSARFGVNFGTVRVHADAAADAAAKSLGARAFTFGSHVAFGRNAWPLHSARCSQA
jgi:hypothetical protein